ncbi:MAG: CopD family protein, partial [Pseudomonadota bacterium]
MLWVKALHLIFMVTWFAGLFYLPRLFVYHALSDDAPSRERFKIMERKLFWGI